MEVMQMTILYIEQTAVYNMLNDDMLNNNRRMRKYFCL